MSAADPERTCLPAAQALSFIQRATQLQSRELRVCVDAFAPGGLSGQSTVEVQKIYSGIDWDAGKIILQPAQPLTRLQPQEVEAIVKSVRAGQSYHAYARERQLLQRLGNALGVKVSTFSAAFAEIEKLKSASAGGAKG